MFLRGEWESDHAAVSIRGQALPGEANEWKSLAFRRASGLPVCLTFVSLNLKVLNSHFESTFSQMANYWEV